MSNTLYVSANKKPDRVHWRRSNGTHCWHFYDEMPPREATAQERRTLPNCDTCVWEINKRIAA